MILFINFYIFGANSYKSKYENLQENKDILNYLNDIDNLFENIIPEINLSKKEFYYLFHQTKIKDFLEKYNSEYLDQKRKLYALTFNLLDSVNLKLPLNFNADTWKEKFIPANPWELFYFIEVNGLLHKMAGVLANWSLIKQQMAEIIEKNVKQSLNLLFRYSENKLKLNFCLKKIIFLEEKVYLCEKLKESKIKSNIELLNTKMLLNREKIKKINIINEQLDITKNLEQIGIGNESFENLITNIIKYKDIDFPLDQKIFVPYSKRKNIINSRAENLQQIMIDLDFKHEKTPQLPHHLHPIISPFKPTFQLSISLGDIAKQITRLISNSSSDVMKMIYRTTFEEYSNRISNIKRCQSLYEFKKEYSEMISEKIKFTKQQVSNGVISHIDAYTLLGEYYDIAEQIEIGLLSKVEHIFEILSSEIVEEILNKSVDDTYQVIYSTKFNKPNNKSENQKPEEDKKPEENQDDKDGKIKE